jgi:molecular chaperone GrpE
LNEDNNIEKDVQSEYDKENSVERGEEAEGGEANGKEKWSPKNGLKGEEKNHKNKEAARLEKALAQAIEERDAFKDSYQRTFSDYNNYKKRNQALTSQAMKTGAGEVLEKILPVLDNLERAIEHAGESSDEALAKGVSMVYKQFSDVITALGVKEIPALGCEFVPNLHQAIQQVDANEGEKPGTVAAVAQKGFMLDDRVLRHSMVIVNK